VMKMMRQRAPSVQEVRVADPQGGSKGGGASQKSSSDTPVLDNFGIDLTKAAEEDRLDPIVGRETEIERLAQILSRRKEEQSHPYR
jgi:ATP-dependent Clp protease ATP-binding subunit ClpC